MLVDAGEREVCALEIFVRVRRLEPVQVRVLVIRHRGVLGTLDHCCYVIDLCFCALMPCLII